MLGIKQIEEPRVINVTVRTCKIYEMNMIEGEYITL